MRKLITLIAVFLILAVGSRLTVGAITSKSENTKISEQLTSGKWLSKDVLKRTFESEPDDVVTRYKTYQFKADGTFILDSAKQRYSGHWSVEQQNIKLCFSESLVSTFRKDTKVGSNKKLTNYNRVVLSTRWAKIDQDHLVLNGEKFESTAESTAGLLNFLEFSSFQNFKLGNIVMIFVGLLFLFLGIKFDWEPLLLVPIGFGVILGNIPMLQVSDFNLQVSIYEPGSVLNYLYQGVVQGWYPPLIFLGIGAMTDFSSLISNPRLMLLGAAAQIGIFITFIGALYLGFEAPEAGAIGIIGGADGPTAIFLSSRLANGVNVLPNGETVKNLIGPIAIAAYSYMALVPMIQPPIIRLLTSKKERLIRMNPPRSVSKTEKIFFPIIGLLLTLFVAPSALPLLGMLFFGNLLKESGVTDRLAKTASNALIDIITMLLGITVGASTQADVFLTLDSIKIFGLGAASFVVATACGVLFAKLMNALSSKDNPINPMIGAAGVSAVPDSARVVQHEGLREDPTNHLLMHAMAPNVSGVIGSAVAAGILLSFLM